MIKKVLGRYVYELRLKNNLSLRDLAKETGLSYSYIHSIENEKVKPSRDVVVALSKGLRGARPDELLRLGGFLPEQTDQGNPEIKRDLLSARLKKCLLQSEWTEETLAVKTNIDYALLSGWIHRDVYHTSQSQVPDIISIYKLANILGVSPDYLTGNAEQPDEFNAFAPRPKNLRDILASEELVLDHITLDEQTKEKLIKIIYAIFDDD